MRILFEGRCGKAACPVAKRQSHPLCQFRHQAAQIVRRGPDATDYDKSAIATSFSQGLKFEEEMPGRDAGVSDPVSACSFLV